MDQLTLADLFKQHNPEATTVNPFITQEFQDYAYRLAMDLSGPEDRQTISLCMRIVKTKPRVLIEQAHSFIKDANAKKKVALFLWKLKTLETETAARAEAKKAATAT